MAFQVRIQNRIKQKNNLNLLRTSLKTGKTTCKKTFDFHGSDVCIWKHNSRVRGCVTKKNDKEYEKVNT